MAANGSRLAGKVALITGAGGGQGLVGAQLFADEGAAVVLADVAPGRAFEAAASIDASGGRALALKLDVRDEAQWRQAIDTIRGEFGALHILVNNAGVVSRVGIMEVSVEEWTRVMDVNLTGCLYGMRAVAPLIRESGGGAIVNISSTAGLMGHAGAAYASSKWGLRGLTKSAAMEFVDWGIRVNSVHPAQVTDTGIVGNALPAYREATARMMPLGRGAQSIEVARVVLFLASDEASYVTGAEIPVDAGYSSFGLPRLREQLVREQLQRDGTAPAI